MVEVVVVVLPDPPVVTVVGVPPVVHPEEPQLPLQAARKADKTAIAANARIVLNLGVHA